MELDLLIRLIAATICGGLVGLEREMHGRVAGLRTHILVCLGSCLVMLVSIFVFEKYGSSTHGDPSRIAAQVVSGIGFLGAGTILRFKASVRGLTTAASLWAVAGIGLACGVGFFQGALITTVLILAVLFVLSKAERKMLRRSWYRDIEVEFNSYDAKHAQLVRATLDQFPVEVKDLHLKTTTDNRSLIVFNLKVLSSQYKDEIQKKLSELPSAVRVSWVEEE